MSWKGFRKFAIRRIVAESALSTSFELEPVDGGPLASFEPGQHLMVRSHGIVGGEPIHRFYTISNAPGAPFYRLTIKRALPPAGNGGAPHGLFSSWMHECCIVGSEIEARSPAGTFCLDRNSAKPVCLLAGGIGITPIMSMLSALDAAGAMGRDIWLFYGVRDPADHAFRRELSEIADRHPALRYHVFYESGEDDPQADRGRLAGRRITLDHLIGAQVPPTSEFYICGPTPMMDSLTSMLIEWGVGQDSIHIESFSHGPAGLESDEASVHSGAESTVASNPGVITITFARSGVVAPWEARHESLLALAEELDVGISSGCWYGDCGTCMTALLDGEVKYNHAVLVKPDPGTILPCSCRPVSSVVLDA